MVCAPYMPNCAVFNHAVFAVVVVDAVAAVVVRHTSAARTAALQCT